MTNKDKLDVLNPNADQPIWRYMDLAKFLSLLETNALHFSRIDFLGDPFEGSVTKEDLRIEEEQWLAMSQDSGAPAGLYEDFYRNRSDDPRASIFVSCWHMGESESVAMWSLYADQHKGIAIKSRVSRLKEFMPEEGRIRKVKYINYAVDTALDLSPIYCKRDAFSHEREVRAVIPRKNPKGISGISIHVELRKLIEEIRLSPEMPIWAETAIKGLAAKYGISVDVSRSHLAAKPLFNWSIGNGLE